MEEFIPFIHINTKSILNNFEHAYSCIELILIDPYLTAQDISISKYFRKSRNFHSHLILSILS
jgi:hypothetical protein